MSRIARSATPIYATRGRPLAIPVSITEPDGGPTDLTGATVSALIQWGSTQQALTAAVPAPATEGQVRIAGPVLNDLPDGRVSELVLTITDSQGAVLDFVWPVVGESV